MAMVAKARVAMPLVSEFMVATAMLAMPMVSYRSYNSRGCKYDGYGDAGNADGVLPYGSYCFGGYSYGGCMVSMHPCRHLQI